MNKKFLLMLLFSACLSSSLKPLSRTKVRAYSTLVGAASGAAVVYGFNKLELLKGKNNRKKVISMAALTSALMTGLLVRNILSSPEDLYEESVDFVAGINYLINEDLILSNENIEKKELIDHINARWGGVWPLVNANNYLVIVHESLLYLSKKLVRAEKELRKSKRQEDLLNKCLAINEVILNYADPLKDRISVITSDENYNPQNKRFSEYLGDKMKADSAVDQGFLGHVAAAIISNRR